MVDQAVDRLAARLRRPARSLSSLSSLSDEQLEQIEAAIDAASSTQSKTINEALQKAWPLRLLLLGRAIQ